MPVTIPPFVQYQQQLIPLRGVWRREPKEGDRFTSIEIDWGLTTLGGTDNTPRQAVQIDVGGNSPVAFSQIAALVVDNNRCSADVTVLFPDSAFELAVPAYAGGVFPVLTNALTFYVLAPQAVLGDVTTLQVCNTIPPPVALLQSQAQAAAAAVGVQFAVQFTEAAPLQLVPANQSGIVEAISIDVVNRDDSPQGVILHDGLHRVIWAGNFFSSSAITTKGDSQQMTLGGLKLRFVGGIHVLTLAGNASFGNINVYYSVP
jgi:hypothetical protein